MAATPTQVAIVLFDESQRPTANKKAAELRERGLNVEVSYSARKLGKQIQHSQKRGAQFIVLPEEDGSYSMKDLSTSEQAPLDVDKILQSVENK